jgi:hypothetical protein
MTGWRPRGQVCLPGGAAPNHDQQTGMLFVEMSFKILTASSAETIVLHVNLFNNIIPINLSVFSFP